MALWQYTFHILPKESVDTLSSNYEFNKDEEGFDDEHYWRLNPVNRYFFNEISRILTVNKSWSNQIDLYGNQESNCFEVFFEDETVFSVTFRIDFTSNFEPILIEIIEYCIYKGLIIVDESLNMVQLNIETIKSIIQNSPQVRKYNELSK